MDASNIAKWIMIAGGILVTVGALLWLLAKAGLPLGQLPGDIRMGGGRTTFHFPIVTCILLSIILTIVLNIILRFFR